MNLGTDAALPVDAGLARGSPVVVQGQAINGPVGVHADPLAKAEEVV